eukprot:3282813-Rhodomonas_salina.1
MGLRVMRRSLWNCYSVALYHATKSPVLMDEVTLPGGGARACEGGVCDRGLEAHVRSQLPLAIALRICYTCPVLTCGKLLPGFARADLGLCALGSVRLSGTAQRGLCSYACCGRGEVLAATSAGAGVHASAEGVRTWLRVLVCLVSHGGTLLGVVALDSAAH